MQVVILPKIEPNMEQASIALWLKKEGEEVKKGEPLFEIETAKALIEVEAEEAGVLRKILVPPGKSVPILTPLAFIGGAGEPLPDLPDQKNFQGSEPQRASEEGVKASPAARRVAKENNMSLKEVKGTGPEGRIVEEDVKRFLQEKVKREEIKKNATAKENSPRRILIIGAGNGGEVVADLLSKEAKNEIVGFIDDNSLLWGKEVWNKPVLGGIAQLEEIFAQKECTHLCVSITSNMKLRRRVYEELKRKGYAFVNALHTTAYINPFARIGEGNIIGAFVHIGYGTTIGNNNLISAHCDIEHHNNIGNHILFGPGVMTSGDVRIDDLCSLGAGVNIEPHIHLAEEVSIASGSTIITHVPAHTVVRKEMKM